LLVEGAELELKWGTGGSRLARHGPNITQYFSLFGGKAILVVWDEPMEGVGRAVVRLPGVRRALSADLLDGSHRLQAMGSATASVGRVERGRCDTRPFAPLPALRRGRSRAYYDKLVARIHDEETKLLEHLGGIVHDLERYILVRKARGKW
jgi:hypothetical protein